MLTRFFHAVVVVCLLMLPVSAQTVRFDTNVGTFDMELNPTGNPNLQGHVENLLTYVEAGRYDLTVVNRAAEDFVMQMGGFRLDTLELPDSFADFPAVPANDPVIVDADNDGSVDFDLTGLNNTRGTVSLALSNDANTGTSSFFINIGDNPSLDADSLRFVPFANVNDMATIDLIMGLQQANLDDGGLAGDDIPLLNDNRLVFVERAFVLPETMEENAMMMALEDDSMGEMLEAVSAGGSMPMSSAPLIIDDGLTVPEPSSFVLAVGALLAIFAMQPGKNR